MTTSKAAFSSFGHDLASVLALEQEQPKASATCEDDLASLLKKTPEGKSSPPSNQSPLTHPSTPSMKTVSAEHLILLESATLADFVTWEKAWADYLCCQLLDCRDLRTHWSALYQALDEDLRHFIRQGIIILSDDDDMPDVIAA